MPPTTVEPKLSLVSQPKDWLQKIAAPTSESNRAAPRAIVKRPLITSMNVVGTFSGALGRTKSELNCLWERSLN